MGSFTGNKRGKKKGIRVRNLPGLNADGRGRLNNGGGGASRPLASHRGGTGVARGTGNTSRSRSPPAAGVIKRYATGSVERAENRQWVCNIPGQFHGPATTV